MTRLAAAGAVILALAAASPASAQSFSCMEAERLNATEERICKSRWLGALDERLAFWYDRALTRAKYFDQASEVRGAQKDWIASRNACGSSFWCIRSHYATRIRQLRNYAEHV